MTSGASLPVVVTSRIESLGFPWLTGYGLMETAGVVVSCAWKPGWNKLPATERARLKLRQGVGGSGYE
ncbi:putative butyrate--CoA ligase [Rosa chinensis]|uniref:Putative butyrate--CoA ligase n=1 Tax=Rosa chinensis TaxID=74649 RepID=A0A2P6PTP8_ROSCH|nr:putative butyrate--CoA ligase [Rosa chinensis]